MAFFREAFLVSGILLLASSTPAFAGKIPSYIHVCKRSDPKVEECIKQSIEELRPQLLKGIPEIQVPSIEPLVLSEVVVSRGLNGENLKAVGKNVKVFGASSFKLESIKVDLDKNEFRAAITIPRLFFEADYEVDAKISVVNLKGNGPLTANSTNVKGDIILKGDILDKGGEKYLTFKDVDLKIDMDNYHIHLDGLFGGDKILGEAANAILNEGNKDFIRVVTPIVERTTADLLKKIANQITENFTYDELFPEK